MQGQRVTITVESLRTPSVVVSMGASTIALVMWQRAEGGTLAPQRKVVWLVLSCTVPTVSPARTGPTQVG